MKAFLVEQLDSVAQLEALLLLHASPEQQFSAADLSRELRIDPAWAEPTLAGLSSRGTVTRIEGDPVLYRFGAKTPEIREAIEQLAATYATRRVSVIALIFSKPPSPLRSFSDAFRLRKDEPNG